jgi:hypothetical protein
VIAAAAVLACGRETVRWTDERRASAVIAPGARLTLQPGGVPAMIAAWLPLVPPVDSAAACPGSVVAVRARGDTAYAAWWDVRPGGDTRLLLARSDDGGLRWRAPVVADTGARDTLGCRRPPPAITADSLNGGVHVAYFLRAAEGAGVFVVHSMEAGTMAHAPVPVVYGDRPSAAAVASRGDTVAVAFEEPNGASPRVWLALSRSGGHIFEERFRVSPASTEATRPGVALRDGRVAVAWFETPRGGGAGTAAVRVGALAW